jgi:hypothetical protein
LNDSKVKTTSSSTIPIPKFNYLNNDKDDDDDDDDERWLTMKPVFRKHHQPQPPISSAPQPEIKAIAGTTKTTAMNAPSTTSSPMEFAENVDTVSSIALAPITTIPAVLHASRRNDVPTSCQAVSVTDLLAATDSIYNRSDPETTTIKSILSTLESTVGVKLNGYQRKLVKDYVMTHHLGNDDNNAKKEAKQKSKKSSVTELLPTQTLLGSDQEVTKQSSKENNAGEGKPSIVTKSTSKPIQPHTTSPAQEQQHQSSQQQQQHQQPSTDALQSATECLYAFSDPDTTMQEAWEAMEAYLGVTLSVDSQKLVEQQWKSLAAAAATATMKQKALQSKLPACNATSSAATVTSATAMHSISVHSVPTAGQGNDVNKTISDSIAKNHARRVRTPYGKSHTKGSALPVIWEESAAVPDVGHHATAPTFSFLEESTKRNEEPRAAAIPLFIPRALKPNSNLVDPVFETNRQLHVVTEQVTKEMIAAEAALIVAKTLNNGKRRFRKARTDNETNQSALNAPATRSRKRPRKDSCALCSSCPCTNSEYDNEIMTTLDLSRTEAEMEKALLRRIAKLERTTESYEQQKETVKKELKKLRRKILKRQVDKLGLDKVKPFGDSYFLPDAEAWDETFQDIATASLELATVSKAKDKLFPPGTLVPFVMRNLVESRLSKTLIFSYFGRRTADSHSNAWPARRGKSDV